MSKFGNSRKESFLKALTTSSLCDDNCGITTKAKFNFKYFDCSQKPYATCLEDLDEKGKIDFFSKLKEYSNESLAHWKKMGIGNGKKRKQVFAVYGAFPKPSMFFHPKHVPHDVLWARFRYGSVRIIGFVCPEIVQSEKGIEYRLDTNTFYLVFIDLGHEFYK